MDNKQVSALLKYLSNSFPNQLKFPTGSEEQDQSMITTWKDWLGEYSQDEVKEAVKVAATESSDDYVPSPAKIASKIENKNKLSPEEAWELAMEAIADYHPDINPNPDLSGLPDAVRDTVKHIGVHKLGSLKVDDTYTQHSFKEVFENIQETRKIREKQLGIGNGEGYTLKEIIEEMEDKEEPKLSSGEVGNGENE